MPAGKTAEANRIVQEYVKTDPKLGYVDITGALLGADGHPDASLFERIINGVLGKLGHA